MRLKLAVFDVDGTLVDSRRTIGEAMDAAFRARGLAAPGYGRTRHVVGLSLEDACRRLAPEGLEGAELSALIDAYKDAFILGRAAPNHHEPLYDGAQTTLARLAEAGWLLSVATGKARRGVQALFERHPIGGFFTSVHCADDGPGKPHPHMVEAAMNAHGVSAAETVVVGDTSHDMLMAKNAGAAAFGVTWGFHERHEIEAAGADCVHDDFAALNAALDAFASALDLEGAP